MTASRRTRRLARAVTALAMALTLVAGAGCGKPSPVVEAGALLLSISAPPDVAVDELRLWIYDDGGVLFDGQRIPGSGALPAAKADGALGTVLVQPGAGRGNLRIHARALAAGVRKLDGVTRVDPARVKDGVVELALFAVVPVDADGDGVPDELDDCPGEANPAQRGCPSAGGDAGAGGTGAAGAAGGMTGEGGAAGSGGAGGGAPGTGGRTATGGMPGTGGAPGTGGRTATGGATTTGGAPATGGTVGSGGAIGTGGMVADGGVSDALRDSVPMEMPRKSLGVACFLATECASGFCVDGLCCESACSQPCQACRSGGQCQDVTRAQDFPQCAGNMMCNQRGMCVND